MFKNKIDLTKIIGIVFFSPAFLFGALIITSILREAQYNEEIDWESEMIWVFIFTMLGLIGSIGMIAKQKWARNIIIVDLTMILISGLYLIYNEWQNDIIAIQIGISFFMISLYLSFIILLLNKKITDEFDDQSTSFIEEVV